MSSPNQLGVDDISEWYDEHLTELIEEISQHQKLYTGKISIREDTTILNKAVDTRSRLRQYRTLGNVTLVAKYEGMLEGLLWTMGVGEKL